MFLEVLALEGLHRRYQLKVRHRQMLFALMRYHL